MENLAGPRLLQAFLDHAPDEVLDSMDNPSKAALRLSCKNAKVFVDGTVTVAVGEASALEAILCCDWRLSELFILKDYYLDPEDSCGEKSTRISPNDFTSLLHAVCLKFPSLQVLEIDSRAADYNLPVNIGQLSRLRTLKIQESRLKALPTSFGQLSSLERLELWNTYESSSRQPPVVGLAPLKQLTQLKYLKLGGLYVRQSFFPDWLGSCHFPVLEDLILCEGFPSSVGNFTSLTALTIENGGEREVPKSIGSLELLKKLSLLDQGHDGFSLPTSFSKLTALEELDVATDMQSFALVEHLTKLTKLTFNRLEEEEELIMPYPEFLWTFTSLKYLDLFGSSGPSLPDALGNLKNLEWLCLRFHQNVEELPETVGYLTRLTTLKIFDCPELVTLPESVENLKLLKVLDISYCNSLTTLPESIGNLQSLEKLEIEQLGSLEILPSSIGNLHALKELILKFVNELFLPESFADLVLDKPIEECSLEEVYFGGFTTLATPGPRVTQALNILQERRVLRCQIRF
jgi:Leucine-rich repeat (LRR) protein